MIRKSSDLHLTAQILQFIFGLLLPICGWLLLCVACLFFVSSQINEWDFEMVPKFVSYLSNFPCENLKAWTII